MYLLALFALYALIASPLTANAETYVISGTKGKTKRDAIVALAKDPKTDVQRCKYTEAQDSNEGKVICKQVELGPRGSIRLVN
jgi:hypothetical protein